MVEHHKMQIYFADIAEYPQEHRRMHAMVARVYEQKIHLACCPNGMSGPTRRSAPGPVFESGIKEASNDYLPLLRYQHHGVPIQLHPLRRTFAGIAPTGCPGECGGRTAFTCTPARRAQANF